jgi:hypothetical protein
MGISTERADRLAEWAVHVTPGRDAGRMVDGVDLVIDGQPPVRMPPRWIRKLEDRGYDSATDGPVSYVVLVDDEPRLAAKDVRKALYEALALIGAGHHPDRLRVEARTPTGLGVQVVSAHRIIGMAIGALEDPPITVIEGPSVLAKYAPGEKRPKRKRRHRRR